MRVGEKKKISELLSLARDVCLLILNVHRYLAQLDANPQNTQTHTAVPSVMSCHSLLGLAFSLARGLDPLSEALNSGPPHPQLGILESREQDKDKRGRKAKELSLYLRVCI